MHAPTTAVLVIDTQIGFSDTWVDAPGTVARIARLVERAREANAPVIWVQDDATLERFSDAWQMPPELQPRPDEARIYKHHWDAFTQPELRDELANRGVTRIAIAGAHTDYCIRTTALRTVAEGYDLVIVADAHTTGDAQLDAELITGSAIIDHTNLYFAGLTYPGRSVEVANHDDVQLDQ
jgi:nicotinamidase-related amidase